MKTFTYSQCNNEFVLSIKKEYKQHDNDSSIKAKYNSLIGDTYIAIENIEEVLSDTDVLQELKVSIENEDTSFANTILGTSNYGNNDSCYRSYLTIDGKNVIEIRIANHYETKKTALEKSNNLSQFIYQVVLITDPPQPQQNDSITTTTTTAHLKILTKGVISKDASEEELSRLLKSIHDYLISPNSEWEISKTNIKNLFCMDINDLYSYIKQNATDDYDILKNKVDEFSQEGLEPIRIYNIISQYIALKPFCRALDVINGDYIEFIKAIKIATFLKAKFNNENAISVMQKTLVYEDNNVCIFKPTNFQESSIIGKPICCFAYSQDKWDEHYNAYEEAIYYVFDVMRENSIHDFVAITVRPNGRALVLDKNHNWWSQADSIRYIQGLGEGASTIVTKKEINKNRK